MTIDQRASILSVIAQEQASVGLYRALLKTETRHAWRVRYRGLRAYHTAQIKRWREELTQWNG